MTLLLQQNLGTAWGASAAAASTSYLLPTMGAAEWIYWFGLGYSAWDASQVGF